VATPGGVGLSSGISGSSVTYAAGGDGKADTGSGANADPNTGDGGEGALSASGVSSGNGGSGIVIIRYLIA
jgi:hypothetical protein